MCGKGVGLSPLLFVVYMDKITMNCKLVEDVKVGDCLLSSLLYADDLVHISRNAKNLQYNSDQLSRTCEEFGMKVNVDKSKTMVLG